MQLSPSKVVGIPISKKTLLMFKYTINSLFIFTYTKYADNKLMTHDV